MRKLLQEVLPRSGRHAIASTSAEIVVNRMSAARDCLTGLKVFNDPNPITHTGARV